VAHVGDELVLVLARDLEVLDCLGKLARSRLDFFERLRVFKTPTAAVCWKLIDRRIPFAFHTGRVYSAFRQ